MTWRAASTPSRVRWWWMLLLAALTVEVVAVLGQLLAAAAAVVGITVVLGVDNRQEAAAWRRASGHDLG